MADYSKVTDAQFDAALAEILDEMTGGAILQIPGVYEAVSEELNNEALQRVADWPANAEQV